MGNQSQAERYSGIRILCHSAEMTLFTDFSLLERVTGASEVRSTTGDRVKISVWSPRTRSWKMYLAWLA